MPDRILIYDSESAGHHIGYIEYLIDYLSTYSGNEYFVFLINKKTIEQLSNLINTNPIVSKLNIQFIPIEDSFQNSFETNLNMFKRALLEKKMIEEYFIEYKINSIIFMALDIFQFVVGSWRFSKFKHIKVSGILFDTYVQEPTKIEWQILLKKIRKHLQLQWLSLHKNIKNIFVLNDQKAVSDLNKTYGLTKKFKFLPDPIKISTYNKVDYRKKFNISEEKKILLVIGGIQRRKNIISVIKATANLDKLNKNKICLMLFGNCNDKLLLKEIIQEINKTNNDFQIIFENKFLNNDEFESALADSSLVFVNYSKFYVSSGIIGHAAKYKKFILASNLGVIGNITQKYKLGITVNPESVEDINKALSDFLNNKLDFQPDETFVKLHTTTLFSSTLFGQQFI